MVFIQKKIIFNTKKSKKIYKNKFLYVLFRFCSFITVHILLTIYFFSYILTLLRLRRLTMESNKIYTLIFDFFNNEARTYNKHHRYENLEKDIINYPELELKKRDHHIAEIKVKFTDISILVATSTTGLLYLKRFHSNLTYMLFNLKTEDLAIKYLAVGEKNYIKTLDLLKNNFPVGSVSTFEWDSCLMEEFNGICSYHNSLRFIIFTKPRESYSLSKKEIYSNRKIYRSVKRYLSYLTSNYVIRCLDFKDFIFFKDDIYIFQGLCSLYSKHLEKKEFNCCTAPNIVELDLDDLLTSNENEFSTHYKCKNCNSLLNVEQIYYFKD